MSLASAISDGLTALGNYVRDSVMIRVLPPGGAPGQTLAKATGSDFETLWSTPAGGLSGQATLELPDGRGVREWIETVSAPGVAPGTKIQTWPALATDDDENQGMDLDVVYAVGVGDTDVITFYVTFSTLTSGPVIMDWRTA